MLATQNLPQKASKRQTHNRIDSIHVNFVDNRVSFARAGVVPAAYRPTLTSLKRLNRILREFSYDQFSIRPSAWGFSAFRNRPAPVAEPTTRTRREFLTTLVGSALAITALAALPAVAQAAPKVKKSSQGEVPPDRPEPYPDPNRTALIDEWDRKIEDTITALESLWYFIIKARGLAPEAVDGDELYQLETGALDAMDNLHSDIEDIAFDDFVISVTGKTLMFWSLKNDIISLKNPAELKAELKAARLYDPQAADELEAYLKTGKV